MIGKTLGHFEILGTLGQGGMGSIYRARDLALGRTVAIKVLPPEMVNSPERKARFIQEAKAASSLQHPNIITIHEIGQDSGVDFIAMECVEGKTLSDLIPPTGLPAAEAVRLATQIAAGLAKAHEADIVHRDLKPANIMVSSDGIVKILDFGIAKLTERAPLAGDDATATDLRTEAGAVLGTVSYMSPEQAEGRRVDGRSDIFSFGAVLYEMVTGHRAFKRETAAATMVAVVRDPVEWKSVPPNLAGVLSRCLEKDVERRFQSMAEVRAALLGVEVPAVTTRSRPAMRWLALPLAIAAAGGGAWRAWSRVDRLPPMKVVALTTEEGTVYHPTFSPDGSQVAYAHARSPADPWQIFVKLVGSATSLQLTQGSELSFFPAWSRDGKQICFYGGRQRKPGIFLISPLGGPERKISGKNLESAPSWSIDNRYLAGAESTVDSGAILLLPVSGGEARVLLRPPQGQFFSSPDFHPTQRRLAYFVCSNPTFRRCQIMVVDLAADWSPSGTPRPVTGSPINNAYNLQWTPDGNDLTYHTEQSFLSYLWRVSASGGTPVRLEIAGAGANDLTVSPRGNRAAFGRANRDFDIWTMDEKGVSKKLIGSSLADTRGQYSPDGKRIAFATARSEQFEIWVANADGSGQVPLTNGPSIYQGSPSWSPDGKQIAYDAQDPGTLVFQIWMADSAGGTPRQITRLPKGASFPRWSRDGGSIYFFSQADGRPEIFRIPAAGGPETQITRNGGYTAHESGDGKTLYFTKGAFGRGIFSLPLAGGPEKPVIDDQSVSSAFAVVSDGIYFCRRKPGTSMEMCFHDLATGKVRVIGKIEGLFAGPISVSPDRKSILFAQSLQNDTNLMLIENFR